MSHQLHEFSELRQKDIFCDALIRVDDGTEFSVHRVILSACSDYFLALFRNNKPNNQGRTTAFTIQIPGIRGAAMKLALDYIYEAKCSLDATNMLELLVVGDYLGVLGLVKYCENFVISAINMHNCVVLMRFGQHRDYLRIFEAAKLYILSEFSNIMLSKRTEMLSLPANQFLELIQDDRLKVKLEDYVWEYCLEWITSNISDRAQYLQQLMLGCRLALVTPQVIQFCKERSNELMPTIYPI